VECVSLILRWLHILAAITAAGGAIFMRFVLLSAVKTLDNESRKAFHERIRSRWSKIVNGAIGVLLVTGLINYFFARDLFAADQQKLPPLYNALFGIKFLLAMGIFFLASALSGRSAAFDKIRANAKLWMSVNVLLIVIVVCLSGVLRSMHVHPVAVEALVPVVESKTK
jgi:uncharacterized membrane protein